MHYADGRSTACEDVMPEQVAGCSDLNITAFLYRVIRTEDPDLVIFTAAQAAHGRGGAQAAAVGQCGKEHGQRSIGRIRSSSA
ncbi:probable inactive purple acid phosphatase 29 [Triticum dicoccoides]|uniref:probable inactive purple acid phosphatase 29 n=1 Tax=Triticum dicoccoides TaxID=85692 RepID=UPI00188E2B65|nr:probable inactive purple acid phosphatase 29 [Triticum dicoccoides]